MNSVEMEEKPFHVNLESSFVDLPGQNESDENIHNNSQTQLLDTRSSSDNSCKISMDDDNQPDSRCTVDISDPNMQIQKECTWNGSLFIERTIIRPRTTMVKFLTTHQYKLKTLFSQLFAIAMICYTVVASVYDFDAALPLMIIMCLVFVFKLYAYLQSLECEWVGSMSRSLLDFYENHRQWIIRIALFLALAAFVTWVALDTMKRPKQLISFAGYLTFLFILFLTSKHPQHVRLRPIFWGCTIQIMLAFVVLRTQYGFHFFNSLGNLVQTFINYVDHGVSFVFGPAWAEHFFAFKVLSIVIYFSAFISILYYLGAMQWLILKIAWLMQKTLGTSPTESMVAAGNIFVGQTEAPLLIRPYINDLTTSELHAVMVCGFGTVSGSVLGAYLGFGIRPVYVITACVMAAPCALAVSKIMFPETKQSKFSSPEGLKLDNGTQRNIIEAAFEGASQAVPLVLNIAANLIAFLALLAALNGALTWFSGLCGFHLNFQILCSYVFYPIALLLGVDPVYASKIAELIGTKVFINEFIAYESLAEMIVRRDNGTYPLYDENGALLWVDERSEAIVTYALCGFANFGSLGIMLGGLGSLAPKRQGEMARIVLRALIGGIFVSILNACISGFLYEPSPINCKSILDQNFTQVVSVDRLFECCSRPKIYNNGTFFPRCNEYPWSETVYNLTEEIGLR